jgi:hypothetical protein
VKSRFVLVCALVLAWASVASAQAGENAFTAADYQYDDSAVHVALEARGEVAAPRVRTEPGFVRVWFPEMIGWTNIDLVGDGGAVRFVRVRPGAGDSGVVVIRLGDVRRLPEGAVLVQREGTRVVLSIDRAMLPPIAGTLPAIPASDAVPPEEPAPVHGASVEAASTTAATEEESAPSDGPRTAAEALAAGGADATPESATAATLGVPTPSGLSGLPFLLGITGLLALALAAVQWLRPRLGGGAAQPNIRVVAATRLSPKQQLVVVRALGQDHLIAIEPGRTERLLSIPTPEQPAEEHAFVPELRLSRPELAPAAGHAPAHAPAAAQPSFGAELLRLVDAREKRATASTMGAPIAAAPASTSTPPSDAVAGLVRLRATAGR